MAPTARKKRKQSDGIVKENDNGGDMVKAQTSKRSTKASRTAGRLAELLDMPMDVLFEVRLYSFSSSRRLLMPPNARTLPCQIFGHLNPFDLLRLARMTREFRRVLMHPSSTSVWKAARAHITDLPDIPPGMSEPAWANLVYDSRCHVSYS